jgi:hypothetical protein
MKKRIEAILVVLLTVFAVMFVYTASASAFLHVAEAQNKAEAWEWDKGGQYAYPSPTGWYDRYGPNRVRVSLYVYKTAYGRCTRAYTVQERDDGSKYIDGASLYVC